ncbi:MAG: M14 family zinc carboxypeptidase [Gemmatimonadota bacterium]
MKKPGRSLYPPQVTLIALGLLASAWACSDGGTGPNANDPIPLTGFEERGGVRFTTHHEELDFLTEIEAQSPRVRISLAGTSVEGRPLHLVRVAHPRPPTDQEIATGQAVLIVGSQHGNEPAGREAALQMLRDLAFTEEEVLLDVLTSATVLFIPSANPDGRVADTRANANQVDINRDHLALVSPEARAIAAVLRDLRPDLVVDAHERPTGTTPDLELLWPRNLNVYGPVRDLSRELVEDWLFDDLAAAGRSVELYSPAPGGAGDENETILRNTVGLRHSLGVLVESAGTRPSVERVAVHLDAFRSTLRFLKERSGEILAAVTAAPQAKAVAGRNRSEPFYLFGADNDPPGPDQILDPPPCAYRLTAEQEAVLQPQITLLPLQTEPAAGTDVLLPMDQSLMTVIPLLADIRARKEVVEAVALVSGAECAVLH